MYTRLSNIVVIRDRYNVAILSVHMKKVIVIGLALFFIVLEWLNLSSDDPSLIWSAINGFASSSVLMYNRNIFFPQDPQVGAIYLVNFTMYDHIIQLSDIFSRLIFPTRWVTIIYTSIIFLAILLGKWTRWLSFQKCKTPDRLLNEDTTSLYEYHHRSFNNYLGNFLEQYTYATYIHFQFMQRSTIYMNFLRNLQVEKINLYS